MNFIGNLLIVFSGLFLTKMIFSPIYLTFSLALMVLIFYVLYSGKFTMNLTIFLSITILLYFLITQFLIGGKENTIINVLFSIIYFIVVSQVTEKLKIKNIIIISERFVNFSILVLFIEASWRLTHPEYYFNLSALNGDLWFYFYKINSIMYQDSNFVGIFIVSLFFFTWYLRQVSNERYYFKLILLFVLSVATFSRASIFTILFFISIYVIQSRINTLKYNKIIFGFILIPLISLILYIGLKFLIDESFESKVRIVDFTLLYLKTADYLTLLFGVGFGNTVNYFGIGSHNFFVTYLVESGIIGISLLVLFWYSLFLRSNYKISIVMIPFLINGMSLAGHAIPYLYTIFAIICSIVRKTKGEIDYVSKI